MIIIMNKITPKFKIIIIYNWKNLTQSIWHMINELTILSVKCFQYFRTLDGAIWWRYYENDVYDVYLYNSFNIFNTIVHLIFWIQLCI